MRSIKYTVVRADGNIEAMRCPSIFSCYEIADRLQHSLVFMHIAPKFSVMADSVINRETCTVYGPAIVLVADEKIYEMPKAPETDGEGYHLWKTYGPGKYATRAA